MPDHERNVSVDVHLSPCDEQAERPSAIDSRALARALDAFCESYGHGIVWTSVLPILQAASTAPPLVPDVEQPEPKADAACNCHGPYSGRCLRHDS